VYHYETERKEIFTEDGQITFLAIRDRAKVLLAEAGAFTMGAVLRKTTGSSFTMMACVDRLVELGEIREITPRHTAGQDRIFVSAKE
jgi:hypothetical protein